jgi:C-terminal processing protease CtpA/Prc
LKPTGENAELEILGKIEEAKQVLDLTQGEDFWQLIRERQNENRLESHRDFEAGDDLIVWKMPAFDLDESKVDSIMGKVGKHKALILDLRGNQGGRVSTLLALVSHFFDGETTIGEVRYRKETKPMIAKARHGRRFAGQTLVLIDSVSASAAEILARVMQLQKRAAVIGDRSAGAVIVAKQYSHKIGTDTLVLYGASITEADLVMTDGKSLERAGVEPDEVLLPTASDLAAARDPVLSRAAAKLGVNLDPDKAGHLFPIEWRK